MCVFVCVCVCVRSCSAASVHFKTRSSHDNTTSHVYKRNTCKRTHSVPGLEVLDYCVEDTLVICQHQVQRLRAVVILPPFCVRSCKRTHFIHVRGLATFLCTYNASQMPWPCHFFLFFFLFVVCVCVCVCACVCLSVCVCVVCVCVPDVHA